MSNAVMSFFFLVGGLYLLLGATLFFNQERFIYFPDRLVADTPARIGLNYESATFATTDGVELHGWFVPADDGKSVVLFCHGNAGNISHRLQTISIIHRLGHPLFIFDYRGYGNSGGTPTEEGTYRDVEAAWDFLVKEKEISPDRIILFGRSLGAAVAARISSIRQPRACVLESAFISAPAMASDLYPFFPASIICRFSYDTLSAVKNIRRPLLIVHSENDEIVPFRHGLALFAAAHEPKTFLKLTGGHNEGFILAGKSYEEGLAAFFAQAENTP